MNHKNKKPHDEIIKIKREKNNYNNKKPTNNKITLTERKTEYTTTKKQKNPAEFKLFYNLCRKIKPNKMLKEEGESIVI